MTWIFVSVGLGVAGLVALGVAGARVVSAARSLKREIAVAKAQLEPGRVRSSGQGDETTPQAAYDRG
ncbi:LapA family protein [Nonomuraea candida]|uniref:LapA family protein n=1 Tax=Nonomuraea candida TaxID=359159 RepID=UPI0005BD2FC3|nr:LapA family protein [Nonomuraea candida]